MRPDDLRFCLAVGADNTGTGMDSRSVWVVHRVRTASERAARQANDLRPGHRSVLSSSGASCCLLEGSYTLTCLPINDNSLLRGGESVAVGVVADSTGSSTQPLEQEEELGVVTLFRFDESGELCLTRGHNGWIVLEERISSILPGVVTRKTGVSTV